MLILRTENFKRQRREPGVVSWTAVSSWLALSCQHGVAARSIHGGDSHMKGARMLVGNFEVNSQMRPLWAWPKLFLTLEREVTQCKADARLKETI